MADAAADDLLAVWVLRTRIRLTRTMHGAAIDLLRRSPKERHAGLIAHLLEYGALYKMMLDRAGPQAVPGAAVAPASQGDVDAGRGAQAAAPDAATGAAITTYPMAEVMGAFVFPSKPPVGDSRQGP